MKTVEEDDVKIHFSSILIDIERDRETFLICRNGKPIADLLPHVEQGKKPCRKILRYQPRKSY